MYDIYNGHYEIGFKMKNRDSYRGTIYNSASRALVTLQDPESLVCRPWYDDASELPSTGITTPLDRSKGFTKVTRLGSTCSRLGLLPARSNLISPALFQPASETIPRTLAPTSS
jgi:hypothetical protein